MQVNKSFETPEGTVKFEGELTQTELDYVLRVGLNYLLGAGAINYTVVKDAQEEVEKEQKDTLQ